MHACSKLVESMHISVQPFIHVHMQYFEEHNNTIINYDASCVVGIVYKRLRSSILQKKFSS